MMHYLNELQQTQGLEKNTEKILQMKLLAAIENSIGAILSVDESGLIVQFNKGAEAIFGYAANEILGRQIDVLMPARFAANHHEHMRRFAQSPDDSRYMQSRGEIFGLRKDGSEFPAEATISKLQFDDGCLFSIILNDVTQRKESEEKLQRFGRILDNTHNEIYIIDVHTLKFVQVNQGALRNLGYTMDELRQMTPLDLKPFLTRADFDKIIEKLRASRDQFVIFETKHRRKDGTLYPVGVRLQYSGNETVPVYVAIIADITERKQAEELQARLNTIIENTTDIIATASPDGTLLYLNNAGRRFMKIGLDESITDYRIADFHRGWALAQAMTEAIPYAIRDGSWLGESELSNCAGEMFRISQLILAHKDETGRLLYLSSVIRDITERQKSEEQLLKSNHELKEAYSKLELTQTQLLQSDKMASIGQLAAGVAHEINNPVGYISSNLGSLRQYIQDVLRLLDVYAATETTITDATARAKVEIIKKEIDIAFLRVDIDQLLNESAEGIHRVKKIVQDLKDFSHVDEAEWQWTNLQHGLDSTLNIVWNELKYKAEVVKEYGDIPDIECLASQLNQVFMNLLINAAHAIENRGTITLRTGTLDNGVIVEITDTGKGMSREIQKRIFEPFFTTKPVGKGTGLGLSLAYGIVQKHHGRIEVLSKVGHGTTFKIFLPIQHAAKGAHVTNSNSV
jgi:two-component system, NtrC family, sensor kinase